MQNPPPFALLLSANTTKNTQLLVSTLAPPLRPFLPPCYMYTSLPPLLQANLTPKDDTKKKETHGNSSNLVLARQSTLISSHALPLAIS